ncbi:MAG: NADH-quinone oxidoreductase subunit NuoH [Dehalococcoidia bacterium]
MGDVWHYIVQLFSEVRIDFVDALESAGLSSPLIVFLESVVGIILILTFVFPMVIIFIWLERRFIAWMQLRPGPNRCGPFGLLQPVADAIKVLFKEIIEPTHGEKTLLWLAPVLVFFSALMLFAVIPIGEGAKGAFADLDIGVLYIVSIGSIGVIGVLTAGWASSNKYALLGSMRAIAQMVSYEIPMVLSLVAIVLMVGSMNLGKIVDAQAIGVHGVPFILVQPLALLVFFAAAIAELNRSPMDQIEAESELTTGYFTEYSGMKFATFFLGEYINTLAVATITVTLFLGGWHAWPLPADWIPAWLVFVTKVFLVFMFILWLRATLVRVRIDQIMAFCWKYLIPVSLINIFVTAGEVLIWVEWMPAWESFPWVFMFVNAPLAIVLTMVWSKMFFKLGGGRIEVREVRPRYSQGDAPDAPASVSA